MAGLRAPRIQLDEQQRQALEGIIRKRSNPQHLVTRAKIIVFAAEGKAIRQSARELGIEREVVQRWRRRWLAQHEVADVRARLSDAPRPGAPARYTPEQICAVVALACESPEGAGRPGTHWTQQELAEEVIRRGIVESISQRSVGRFLKEADLQPHRVRNWLHTDKTDEHFEDKCDEVCETYAQAPARAAQGQATYSIDETGGIQALERLVPGKPPAPAPRGSTNTSDTARRC